MRRWDRTFTADEALVIAVIRLASPAGALLAGATRPALGQVSSRVAKGLARAGVVAIDVGGTATLTEEGRRLVAREERQRWA